MTLPKYNQFYIPLLKCLKDGEPKKTREVMNCIAREMKISDEEIALLLPSGKQRVFDNRVGWASVYLRKAGLIENTSRGVMRITGEGSELLDANPVAINNDTLMQYGGFKDFIESSKKKDQDNGDVGKDDDSPQEILETQYRIINETLAQELLEEVVKLTPSGFESLVVQLLVQMGYGGMLKDAGIQTGRSGDEGIDGIIREDKLGFNMIYIQAKCWGIDQTVGRPDIQRFVGALAGQGASKGLFITTAKFSKEALAYARIQHTTKVILVDGRRLANLMIEHGLGVSTEARYEIKRIDSDFFTDSVV